MVAPVATELLARSAREDLTGRHPMSPEDKPADATVVANVPADLLAKSAGASSEIVSGPKATPAPSADDLDPEDHAHFKDVYDRFIDLRRRCASRPAIWPSNVS